ncbi:glutathione peroxidase [Enterococcus villorum]|uniref:Glutathione peroxidase n=2 Tax=Enterococcus villorum TaxID=112904 RepID=A0A511J2F3_9ENTE|nr:glutathione peroxidase [Enterococcus villorum]EOH88927.1 glutathione peroxidase [Enterococcus villorum ATCC 700913]EOW76564.1 glutathione peroxidase [Enterococcus villorum ATCC 700913]GEL92185.1 glutathione peroxidase [Enterococcus villorum]
MNIYDFTVTLENGTTYSLDKYKGHPMIIVNTATKCGLAPQFEQLEELYERYQSQGLVILGFPSNQFKQEVATASDAAQVCRTTYGVTFPMHQIIDVNGSNADPLFEYLKKQAPGTLSNAIKWNFTKFLVDKDGNVVERFAPKTIPIKMIDSIEAVL